MKQTNLELELSENDMRALTEVAAKYAIEHIKSLAEQPSNHVTQGAQLARNLIEPLPQRGIKVEPLFQQLFEQIIPCSYTTPGPGYLAYIPGGGLFHSAVADLVANAVNRYVGVWLAAPGLVQLETNVIRWFCDIVGYPKQALGILTTGGSMANFSAVVAARVVRLPEAFLKGILYVSSQVHHSIGKAAKLAGFPAANVRAIPCNPDYSISIEALVQALKADRQAGLMPFMVVGSAGTTNTGAVDDLDSLADLARQENLWFHVDGAYGAFFMLTETGRRVMKGIQRADSITLDPHKGLFLPYGTGALLVKDRQTLQRAHSGNADYMPTMQKDENFIDYCELSPELSRDFRGLRVWLPLKLHGIQPFCDNLEEKLELTRWITRELKKLAHIEIVAEPQLSVVAFRWTPPGVEGAALNALNQKLIERINARQRVILSGTMLAGTYVVRICILSFRTHAQHVRYALEDLQSSMAELR